MELTLNEICAINDEIVEGKNKGEIYMYDMSKQASVIINEASKLTRFDEQLVRNLFELFSIRNGPGNNLKDINRIQNRDFNRKTYESYVKFLLKEIKISKKQSGVLELTGQEVRAIIETYPTSKGMTENYACLRDSYYAVLGDTFYYPIMYLCDEDNCFGYSYLFSKDYGKLGS